MDDITQIANPSNGTASAAVSSEMQLAANMSPTLHFDANEPFLPGAVGYTIHVRDGMSASADHPVRLKGACKAIEYSIWWDWDIQHLYELEHIWVFLDEQDQIVRVEASAHGCVGEMTLGSGNPAVVDGRVTLFSEPGKHAFASDPEKLCANYYVTTTCCLKSAGGETLDDAILVPDSLRDEMGEFSIYDRHVARGFMQSKRFKPSFRFEQTVDLRDIPLMPWPELKGSIPARVRSELTRLRKDATGVKAVFLDSGDTLIDESSQIFVEGELVLQANPIPGGDRLVAELKNRGYLVALVADGLVESFENVHQAMGFWHLFDAVSISEEVGAEKPDAAMFRTAVDRLGLTEDDLSGCVMVGNNLTRDIAGANRLGLRSVWISWTDNYPKHPASDLEVPDFEIKLPHQLLDVLVKIDSDN